MLKRISQIFIVCTILTIEAFSQGLMIPFNLDFEHGAIGYEPPGWDASRNATNQGYIFVTNDSLSYTGKKSLVINSPNTTDTSTIAHIKQSLNAYVYRGRKINFSAAALAYLDNPSSYAFLWANIRDKNGDIIASFSSQDKPILLTEWNKYSLTLDIPENAETINYGFALRGSGTVFFDNVSFTIIQTEPKYNADTTSLSSLALRNIISFAEVYGLVRFFYPNFYSDKIDWENFLLLGITTAERASTPQEFTSSIKQILSDIAPLANFEEKEFNQLNSHHPFYSWLHTGIPSHYANAVSNSKLIDINKSQRTNTALLVQRNPINVGKIEPLNVEITSECALKPEISSAYGNILVRFEDQNGKVLSFSSLDEPFMKSSNFSLFKIKSKVPENTQFIRLAINLDGDGELYVKNIEIKIIARKLKNPRVIKYEFVDEKMTNWELLDVSKRAGYDFSIDAINSLLKIYSTNHNKILLPKKNSYSHKLYNDILFNIPTILPLDSSENANINLPFRRNIPNKVADFITNINDRLSRIATFIDLWNYIAHFGNISDNAKLYNFLEEAIIDISKNADTKILDYHLNRILFLLSDNNALIERYNPNLLKTLPILLKQIGDNLIVYRAHNTSPLKPGDIIKEINGIPAEKALQQIETYIAVPNNVFRRIIAINRFLQGEPESEINFTVLRNDKPIKITETRRLLPGELLEERPERYEIFGDSIVYCDLTRTNDKELNEISRFMEKYPVLIFDLRGQSQVSEYFLGLLATDTVVSLNTITTKNTTPFSQLKNDFTIYTNIKPYKRLAGKKIYFLCDERSVTLSETILATAQLNKLGTIIGRPTAGASGEICSIALPCQYFLTATTAKVFYPTGEILTGKSIKPDIFVDYDVDLIKKNTDEILYKTLELIKNERTK